MVDISQCTSGNCMSIPYSLWVVLDAFMVCIAACLVVYGEVIAKIFWYFAVSYYRGFFYFYWVNPLTPMSDQHRISPYNINTISTRY